MNNRKKHVKLNEKNIKSRAGTARMCGYGGVDFDKRKDSEKKYGLMDGMGMEREQRSADRLENDVNRTQKGVDKLQKGREWMHKSADRPQKNANKPNGADRPQREADRLEKCLDRRQKDVDRLTKGEDRTRKGADRTQKGAGRTREGADRTQKGADRTREGADRTQRGADKTQKGADKTQREADRLNKSWDGLEKGGDRIQKGADKSKKGAGKKVKSVCPVFRQCGGCQMLDMPYKDQLVMKQKNLEGLLKGICKVNPIIGMENPYHYRNKVHAVFGHRKGEVISGVYKAGTHILVPVESCLIEDQKADEIIGTIRGMLKSFKIRTYDEDSGYGLLRHVLVKKGFTTGEIMVVLVTASPIFPSRNNFVKALREKHPEITTIIQNINDRVTSMVLGDKEKILFGKGYIEDVLCGCMFRISSKSFYQVNPVQTEILYGKAIEAAELTGKETVIDAYCGIGTIGIIASRKALKVIGVELNQDAVRDAVENGKRNDIRNIQFYQNDAGKFMVKMAEQGEKADVIFMDPPRSGSTEAFMDSVAVMKPRRVVYVSCNPETLVRDLKYLERKGYGAVEAWGVDLFPMVGHCEVCVELCRK